MQNSESAHLFTYNYFWKLVSISIIITVLFLQLFNAIRTNKQTHKHTHTQQLSFNNIDMMCLAIAASWHMPPQFVICSLLFYPITHSVELWGNR